MLVATRPMADSFRAPALNRTSARDVVAPPFSFPGPLTIPSCAAASSFPLSCCRWGSVADCAGEAVAPPGCLGPAPCRARLRFFLRLGRRVEGGLLPLLVMPRAPPPPAPLCSDGATARSSPAALRELRSSPAERGRRPRGVVGGCGRARGREDCTSLYLAPSKSTTVGRPAELMMGALGRWCGAERGREALAAAPGPILPLPVPANSVAIG